MAYNFILDGVQFPVAPPSLSISINGKNETVTLIDEGEINILKKPGLSDIEFELLLPNTRYPFATYTNGYQPAPYYMQHIENVINKVDDKGVRQPSSFIVNRILNNNELLFDTNFNVSIESYTIEEDADSLGRDVRITLSLKQYRSYGTKLLKTQKPATPNTNAKVTVENKRATVNKVTPKTYTVKNGDTLYKIAKQFLGNGNLYKQIADKNKISNPNLIRVGQVLQL